MQETRVRFPTKVLNILVHQELSVTFCTQLWHSLIYFYGQSVRTGFPQRLVNVMADSCVGGLVVMMLTWNARDRGSIPHWGTEPTVTIQSPLQIFLLLYKSIPFTFVHWLPDIMFVLLFVLVELLEKIVSDLALFSTFFQIEFWLLVLTVSFHLQCFPHL